MRVAPIFGTAMDGNCTHAMVRPGDSCRMKGVGAASKSAPGGVSSLGRSLGFPAKAAEAVAFEVVGAGTAKWNGRYKLTGAKDLAGHAQYCKIGDPTLTVRYDSTSKSFAMAEKNYIVGHAGVLKKPVTKPLQQTTNYYNVIASDAARPPPR